LWKENHVAAQVIVTCTKFAGQGFSVFDYGVAIVFATKSQRIEGKFFAITNVKATQHNFLLS